MSFLRQPKVEPAPPTHDAADAANRANEARTKRLNTGGRNATFLSQTQAAAAANRSPNTLTGLNG